MRGRRSTKAASISPAAGGDADARTLPGERAGRRRRALHGRGVDVQPALGWSGGAVARRGPPAGAPLRRRLRQSQRAAGAARTAVDRIPGKAVAALSCLVLGLLLATPAAGG